MTGIAYGIRYRPVVWSYTLHVIFILTATPLFLLVAIAIGLEYMLRIAVSRGIVAQSAVVESASECKQGVRVSRCRDVAVVLYSR